MQPIVTPSLEYRGISIFVGDITKVAADAIVNAANELLLGGGGIDGSIHRAAGPRLLAECRTLNGCLTGQSKMTGGYNLPSKHVIHTVGPDCRIISIEMAEPLLQSCYETCLDIAEANHLESIVFCCISIGIFHFPKDKAAKIALETISKSIDAGLKCKVYICCYTEDDLSYYANAARQLTSVSELAPAPAANDLNSRHAYFTRRLQKDFQGEVLRKAVDRVIENQDRYCFLLRSTKVSGIDELITAIHKSDFFTGHSHSHHQYATGLVEHSLGVYDQMVRKAKEVGYLLDPNDIIFAALLHDICMARNNEWPHVKGKHGLNSRMITEKYLHHLTPAVLEAIEKHRHDPSPEDKTRNPLWYLIRMSDIEDAKTSPKKAIRFPQFK